MDAAASVLSTHTAIQDTCTVSSHRWKFFVSFDHYIFLSMRTLQIIFGDVDVLAALDQLGEGKLQTLD